MAHVAGACRHDLEGKALRRSAGRHDFGRGQRRAGQSHRGRPTGAETELLVEGGEAQITLAVHGRVDAQPDQMVGLVIASESVHLFDRQSGQRLS
jgi:hypothetical protein